MPLGPGAIMAGAEDGLLARRLVMPFDRAEFRVAVNWQLEDGGGRGDVRLFALLAPQLNLKCPTES